MERYLLFDSGCSLCSNLAQSVQAESNGLLMARSLREPAIQAILNEVKPGWQWEPMLLEMDDDGSQQVFSGLQMRLRIVSKLGLSHAWRIAKLVGRTQLSANTQHAGRRSFLRYAGGVVTGAAMAGLHFSMGKAQTAPGVSPGASSSRLFLPMVTAIGSPSAADVDEAKHALSILLESSHLEAATKILQTLGLHIVSGSTDLEGVKIEGDVTIFKSDASIVSFLNEQEGRRLFQVILPTENSEDSSTTDEEITLLVGFVDTISQQVGDIVQMKLFSTERGTQQSTGSKLHVKVESLNGQSVEYVVADHQLVLVQSSSSAVVMPAHADWCSFIAATLCTAVGRIACLSICAAVCIYFTAGFGCTSCPVICSGGAGVFCGLYVHCDENSPGFP